MDGGWSVGGREWLTTAPVGTGGTTNLFVCVCICVCCYVKDIGNCLIV